MIETTPISDSKHRSEKPWSKQFRGMKEWLGEVRKRHGKYYEKRFGDGESGEAESAEEFSQPHEQPQPLDSGYRLKQSWGEKLWGMKEWIGRVKERYDRYYGKRFDQESIPIVENHEIIRGVTQAMNDSRFITKVASDADLSWRQLNDYGNEPTFSSEEKALLTDESSHQIDPEQRQLYEKALKTRSISAAGFCALQEGLGLLAKQGENLLEILDKIMTGTIDLDHVNTLCRLAHMTWYFDQHKRNRLDRDVVKTYDSLKPDEQYLDWGQIVEAAFTFAQFLNDKGNQNIDIPKSKERAYQGAQFAGTPTPDNQRQYHLVVSRLLKDEKFAKNDTEKIALSALQEGVGLLARGGKHPVKVLENIIGDSPEQDSIDTLCRLFHAVEYKNNLWSDFPSGKSAKAYDDLPPEQQRINWSKIVNVAYMVARKLYEQSVPINTLIESHQAKLTSAPPPQFPVVPVPA
jgi:hypothetical protein